MFWPITESAKSRRIDPYSEQYLASPPIFSPLERVLHRLEADGTVEAGGRQIVFKEDSKGGWYDLPAALRGVVGFTGSPRAVTSCRSRSMQCGGSRTSLRRAGSPIFSKTWPTSGRISHRAKPRR